MRAALKSIFSMDVGETLDAWIPSDPEFGIKLMLFIGCDDDGKSDAFDLFLCTPRWFAMRPLTSQFVHGKYHLFVEKYDYLALVKHLESRCRDHQGDTWPEVASQINEWASWEFAGLAR